MSVDVSLKSTYVNDNFFENVQGNTYIFSGTTAGNPVPMDEYWTKEEMDTKYVSLTTDQSISGFKTFNYDLSINSDLYVQNTLYVDSDVSFGNDLYVTNDITALDNLWVYGRTNMYDQLTVNAIVAVGSYLHAQDLAYFYKSLVDFDGFVSGFAGSGWKIDKDPCSGITATFDNINIRNTMRVYELLVEQIRANNGSLWISNGLKATDASEHDGYWYVAWDTDDGNVGCPFVANDIIRAQTFDGRNILSCQLKVSSIGSTYFRALDGDVIGDDPSAKMEFVRIGNTTDTDRQGSLYLTASDDEAPFLDIVDGVNQNIAAPFTGKNVVRLGKLDGITDVSAGLDGSQDDYYGLYSRNIHLKGHIYAYTGWIGNWDISSYQIQSTYSDEVITIKSQRTTSGQYGLGFSYYNATQSEGTLNNIQIGQIYARQGYTECASTFSGSSYWGINITTRGSGTYDDVLFRVGDIGSAQISSWFFDEEYFWTGTKKTTDGYSSSGITLDAGDSAIRSENFRIDSDGKVFFRTSSTKGVQLDSDNNQLKFIDASGNTALYLNEAGNLSRYSARYYENSNLRGVGNLYANTIEVIGYNSSEVMRNRFYAYASPYTNELLVYMYGITGASPGANSKPLYVDTTGGQVFYDSS